MALDIAGAAISYQYLAIHHLLSVSAMSSGSQVIMDPTKMENKIYRFVSKENEVKTYAGTSNFVLQTGDGLSVEDFWKSFSDLLGRGKEVLTDADEKQLKTLYSQCLSTFDTEQTYFNLKDVAGNFVGTKISVRLKKSKDELHVNSKIAYAIVDMSKERWWTEWKKGKIVSIIDEEHAELKI